MTVFFKDQAWLASLTRGVILHTDGRLQRIACLDGLDLEAAQPAELVGMWATINDTLRTLGREWLVLVQTCRCVPRVEKVAWFAAPRAMLSTIASKAGSDGKAIAGFEAPVHRALTEPILLAGVPRSVAIINGTLAAAIGLGLRLWLIGLALWGIGHMAAAWAARRDPFFVEVVRRHVRYPTHFGA